MILHFSLPLLSSCPWSRVTSPCTLHRMLYLQPLMQLGPSIKPHPATRSQSFSVGITAGRILHILSSNSRQPSKGLKDQLSRTPRYIPLCFRLLPDFFAQITPAKLVEYPQNTILNKLQGLVLSSFRYTHCASTLCRTCECF